MTQDVTPGGGLILYHGNGNKRAIKPEQLEQLVQDGPSWLRYTVMVMGGPPARMLAVNGEHIFVQRALRAKLGENFADMDSRYPAEK